MKTYNCSISQHEDGSFLIEIYGDPNFRIGLIVDKTDKDSSWYVVGKMLTDFPMGNIGNREEFYKILEIINAL